MRSALIALLFASSAFASDFPGWMAGSWRGTKNGVAMEEHWTTANGDLMLGMHRDVKPGKRTFEFLRVERHDDGNLYYMAMPAGRPATPFKMTSHAGQRVVFENPEHDFPKRIIYWRVADGRLCARAEGSGGESEKASGDCWVRAASVQ